MCPSVREDGFEQMECASLSAVMGYDRTANPEAQSLRVLTRAAVLILYVLG